MLHHTKQYFGTDGIRGRVGQYPITPEFMLKLGWAAGKVLAPEGGKILIGKDTRISGYMFESALEAGLSAAGTDVHLLGPMPTPAIAYLTHSLRAQGSIVISASHNAYADNGIKFFNAEGNKLCDQLEQQIEQQLEQPLQTTSSDRLGKAKRLADAAGRYIEFCKSSVATQLSLKNLKIVLDCAHGANYQIAPQLFTELGAQIIELGTQPNGLNINADCGSLHPQHLQALVVSHQAHLGIAFDGDGDRLIMVDEYGELLDGDTLLWIMAKHLHSQQRLSGGIVGTVMSNMGLELALLEQGIAFERAAVGDRYVLEKLRDKGWLLGGEASGHIIYLAASTTGDGIIAALQILAAIQQTGQSLHQLKAGMIKLPQVIVNVPTQQGHILLQQAHIQASIQTISAQLGKRGRVLLRPSGTEPLLRIMVEGEDQLQVEEYAAYLAAAVSQ
jgi:phosphoglucosamine mutase